MSKLSERIRPNSEAAPWVIEEVKRMEQDIERLRAEVQQLRGGKRARDIV
jgi:ubiquinone biosynthesis protein UbiJ